MSELTGLHLQINELDEYEQYLLSALLKKAAADAGKKLNISERRAVAAEFFVSRQDDRKNRASNHGFCAHFHEKCHLMLKNHLISVN
ncbi:TPA: hypothetical protein G8M05_004975 [Salmonella enterica]|nr:hypothetical protein [Salmonella enterica]